MSVWSTVSDPEQSLLGSEGALVAVSIKVAAPRLEALLDALAHLDFPVNPEIKHDTGTATVVEFPAYEKRLPEIRSVLAACGFASDGVKARAMLESIRAAHAGVGP